MVRTMAVDWESPKRERKEYFYYTTEWEARPPGNVIKCPHENEGDKDKQRLSKQNSILLEKEESDTMREEHQRCLHNTME